VKILITGGAGYIGNELVCELTKNPKVEKVVVYDNLSRKNYNLFLDNRFESSKVQFVTGDLLDSRNLRQVLKDIDVVFHLAAKVSTPLSSEHSHLFEQVNHWGTAELVYAVEESSVSRFVYLSTTSVYGASENMINIETPPDPRTFYGSSKLRGESHVERLFGKMNAWVLRCGNVYGYSPSIRLEAVINRFMFEANFIGRIQITGNGKQQRAFIHISKVVNALVNLLEYDLPTGTYNLSEHNISIEAIAALIKKIYPSLDMIFVNQHLVMREIKVEADLRLRNILTMPPATMEQELLMLREKFSFSKVHREPRR